MKRVPDRKKLRREYLRKKTRLYTYVLVVSLTLSAIVVEFVSNPRFRGMIVLILFVLIVFIPSYCEETVEDIRQEIKEKLAEARTPYVPAVTPATLPPEEILVRGAAEPSAPCETLLRATMKSEPTKPDELLRTVEQLRGE